MAVSTSLLSRATFAAAALAAAALAAGTFAASAALAQEPVMVGGAPMYPDRTIVENASTADNLTTLVAAVKAADLVETLSSPGPFTVFAPTDDAFAKLPEGTVEALVQPDMKDQLTEILTYHVVAGDYSATDLIARAMATDGSASIETVAGRMLTLSMDGNTLVVTDENGGAARVILADVAQSNGMVHAVDTVLLPKM
ncbi:MAG: fasciclin domain-containing protein [Alphaproteobacteria bacterium]